MSVTLLLYCQDLRTTREYYRNVLGFQVEESPETTITASLNGGSLVFTESDLWNARCGASATIYFGVPDVDAYFESIGNKVTVAWDPRAM